MGLVADLLVWFDPECVAGCKAEDTDSLIWLFRSVIDTFMDDSLWPIMVCSSVRWSLTKAAALLPFTRILHVVLKRQTVQNERPFLKAILMFVDCMAPVRSAWGTNSLTRNSVLCLIN